MRDASVCLLRPASAPAWVHPTTTTAEYSGPMDNLVNATAAVQIQVDFYPRERWVNRSDVDWWRNNFSSIAPFVKYCYFLLFLFQDSESLPDRAESVPLFQKGGGLLPLFSNPTKEQQDVACVFNQVSRISGKLHVCNIMSCIQFIKTMQS